jgi:peptidyl-prolyl cis-trans isomerase B (cyclophilin B)
MSCLQAYLFSNKAAICLSILMIVAGCDDPVGEKQNRLNQTLPTPITHPSTKEEIPASKFPFLSNANAEPFLLKYFDENKKRKIAVSTRLGTLKVRLYDETPLHTANFLMLAERDYFNDTEFTRVVKDFVVQGGNNDNETEEIKRMVIGNYQIRAELDESLIHKRGALAMARSYENNPNKLSSAYDFYFVHGRTFNEPQLMAIERENEMNIPAWKREVYYKVGGAPHLDGQHTVFGEIYEGFDVLDKMASVETDASNWPNTSLIMKIEILDE